MSGNEAVGGCAAAVVLDHSSALVADVLARALVLAGVPCRVGSSSAAGEALVGDRPGVKLAIGPSGVIGEGHEVQHLVVAVRDLLAGRRPTPPPRASDSVATLPTLTERERQVLLLLTAGASNEAMAEELAISPHTVRTHVQNLLGKLGVQNRLAAAAVARRAGLLAVGA